MRKTTCLLLIACVSGAGADEPSALERCRRIAEPMARLQCYDAIPLPAPPRPAPARAADQKADPAAPARAGDPASAAGRSAPPVEAAAQFGLESRPQPTKVAVDSIESTIPGRFTGWVRGTRFRLANGQVWEVRDTTQGAYDLIDPKVRIVRGISGSFFMEVAGVSQTPRVRRVE